MGSVFDKEYLAPPMCSLLHGDYGFVCYEDEVNDGFDPTWRMMWIRSGIPSTPRL